jgi:mannose-6-phosphate isomerase
MKPYPLQFVPEMKERVWGGRALEQFGFTMPEGPIGEAWVIGDHPNGTTKVSNGPLAGTGLDEIREQYGKEWFGTKGVSQKSGRFPLLLKLLDCQDDLSIQVHPNDHYERLAQGELGKTEMWYVLDAKPGSTIIYGLKPGQDRASFAKLIEEDRILEGLQEVPVSAGDTFYIPAGTVHALRAGVLVVEVQQNSDTTYRLYDYNRPGLDGKPRELHIEDSLNVIEYGDSGASKKTTAVPGPNQWLRIAESPYFLVEKAETQQSFTIEVAPESFELLVIGQGNGALVWADGRLDVKPGDSFLLPANLGSYTLSGDMTVLRSYLP